MDTLPSLYTKVIGLLPPGKHQYVSPAAVLAVCMQESKGSPCFFEGEELLKENLADAVKGTTLPASLLMDAMRIEEGPLLGGIAKFRFEPAYWQWTATQQLPSPTLRFLCSCSIGIGQQMMRWVLPKDKLAWPSFVEKFKSDIDLQLQYVIGSLEKLLKESEGDLFKSYKGYNSGNINSARPDVISRAQHVVELRNHIQKQLQG